MASEERCEYWVFLKGSSDPFCLPHGQMTPFLPTSPRWDLNLGALTLWSDVKGHRQIHSRSSFKTEFRRLFLQEAFLDAWPSPPALPILDQILPFCVPSFPCIPIAAFSPHCQVLRDERCVFFNCVFPVLSQGPGM